MNPDLGNHYQRLMRKIASLASERGAESKITLVAVSKTQTVEAIQTLYKLGHRDFGENYAQEMLEKAVQLEALGCDEIRWHFIGHLQTNKVKSLASRLFAVHSIDSEKLAIELNNRLPPNKRVSCFLEVNVNGETSKSGIAPGEAPALARLLADAGRFPKLKLEGLMAIPAATEPALRNQAFTNLRELELKCRPHTAGALSMGMSEDFELAIAQGATHVRVGTALFGARQPK